MSDFINDVPPRPTKQKATNINKSVLENSQTVYTPVYTKKLEKKPTIKKAEKENLTFNGKKKSILVSMRLTEERLKALDNIAKNNDTTRQDVINTAIDNLIKKAKNK